MLEKEPLTEVSVRGPTRIEVDACWKMRSSIARAQPRPLLLRPLLRHLLHDRVG